MKKLLLLITLVIALNFAYSQSNIPNGGLEDWYEVVVPGATNFHQPGVPNWDNFLFSLNELASIPPPIGPGPVTVFRTDDKYSGTYAAKLVSAPFQISDSVTVFIPGMLGTAKLYFAGIKALIGKGCPGCRPLKVSGYYKAEPVNGDSCAVVILVSKWNSETHKKDTIGYGRFVEYNQVTTYTSFDVPVVYNPEMISAVPDSLTILAVSSAGFNAVNFMFQVGQPGSTMYVDELMLEYPMGLGEALMPDIAVNCYPNPAKNNLIVELSQVLKDGNLEVYDLSGKFYGSFSMGASRNTIPVNNLPNGTYFFKLKEGAHILNTGSFVVQR